jgi:transcriptional regulator with XRE-family HTH domain
MRLFDQCQLGKLLSMPREMTPFDVAIFQAGGMSALALQIGVSRMAVWKWKKFGIPTEDRLRAVAKAGGVPESDLRPYLKEDENAPPRPAQEVSPDL